MIGKGEGANSEMATLLEQVLENLEFSIVGIEGIVFPTTAVLVIMDSLAIAKGSYMWSVIVYGILSGIRGCVIALL